jgi:putative ABC transport system permease protein
VVSESLAQRYWPNQNPIGKRIFVSFFDREVVGVVGDIRVRGLERNSEPQVYIPSKQIPDGWMPFYAPKDLVVRAGSNAAALGPAIRDIIRRADPELPVSDIRLLSDIVAADTGARRVQLWALGTLAALAFALAAIGIHGLLSYSVASRSQEVGIRIALGADRQKIVAMFLRQAGLLALLGIVIGMPLALWVARSLQVLLAGVPAADPVTIGSAVALVAVMTSIGSFVPALRAVRVDPAAAIRGE